MADPVDDKTQPSPSKAERDAAKAAAAKQQAEEQAARDAAEAAAEKAKDDEPKFTADRILANSVQMVGYPAHVVAGAIELLDSKEFTKAEVKAACAKFLKVEVV